ncbi:hypothetical protein PBY51_004613 [Eleginops maclovinus]|uniref:Uncharacterized protein n=1 Tax=Eleginops maclovinus TaxID=56733 RepID=A0AAN8AX62_ELEMC|nr:hypothetical protein PBY51_004613 [Eleginops maclovinus]
MNRGWCKIKIQGCEKKHEGTSGAQHGTEKRQNEAKVSPALTFAEDGSAEEQQEAGRGQVASPSKSTHSRLQLPELRAPVWSSDSGRVQSAGFRSCSVDLKRKHLHFPLQERVCAAGEACAQSLPPASTSLLTNHRGGERRGGATPPHI